MKQHTLINNQNGKSVIYRLSKKTVITETKYKGNSRVTKKGFDTLEEAEKQFYKKEWTQLKKGLILSNTNAKSGEAVLHYYIGGGYTGCLSLTTIGDSVAVYQQNDSENDIMQVIDQSGNLLNILELPSILPWSVSYDEIHGSIYMDIDHLIYQYNLKNKKFEKLTKEIDQPCSFISFEGRFLAYASHPLVYVKDLDKNQIIYSQKVETELYGGHTPVLNGAISTNGEILAIQTKCGEIRLINILTNQTDTICGNFKIFSKLVFCDNDKKLLAQEQYGICGLYLFDVESKVEIKSDIKIKHHHQEIDYFCFNSDKSRLSVFVRAGYIFVFDWTTREQLNSFKCEHIVKKAEGEFITDDILGIRTDYGCFSLYKI